MINVTRSSMPPFEEYMEEIRELWDTRFLTNGGVKHKKLEAMLKEYLNAPELCLFTNGHLALEYALQAMGFEKDDEVITTPFTFASTTTSIVRSGLKPVFADIKKDDFTMDAEKVEALITEKTRAIMPVHVYGNLCDTEKIEAIAQKHGLFVLYDAAHAFGVTKNGVSAANFGDASMFSFHATKVFNTVEGGALIFRDGQYGKKLEALKNFGITGRDEYSYAGGNAKMSEFHAAMGICNLLHVNDEIEKRRAVFERYIENLSGAKGLLLPKTVPGIRHNYAYFPVVFDGFSITRDEAQEKLSENGIMSRKYFYPTTNAMPIFKEEYRIRPEDTPTALEISQKVLTLPLYADMTMEDTDRISEILLRQER